jgi:hypothetical protein
MSPPEDGAIRVDAYLDELLATRGAAGPRVLPEAIEPELEAVSRLAQRALARFHPSFRFEERLAARLALEVAGGAPPAIAGETALTGFAPEGTAPPQPMPMATADMPVAALALETFGGPSPRIGQGPIAGIELRGRGGRLLGGAIASGVIASGVSIAGAALIARARRARAEQRWQDLG